MVSVEMLGIIFNLMCFCLHYQLFVHVYSIFAIKIKTWNKIPFFSENYMIYSTADQIPIFSSPGPKGLVSFCHHFASGGSVVVVRVCKLFIFSSSSLKLLNRFGPYMAEMFIGRSSTRFVVFVQIGNPTWLPGPIMCSDWMKL